MSLSTFDDLEERYQTGHSTHIKRYAGRVKAYAVCCASCKRYIGTFPRLKAERSGACRSETWPRRSCGLQGVDTLDGSIFSQMKGLVMLQGAGKGLVPDPKIYQDPSVYIRVKIRKNAPCAGVPEFGLRGKT